MWLTETYDDKIFDFIKEFQTPCGVGGVVNYSSSEEAIDSLINLFQTPCGVGGVVNKIQS